MLDSNTDSRSMLRVLLESRISSKMGSGMLRNGVEGSLAFHYSLNIPSSRI